MRTDERVSKIIADLTGFKAEDIGPGRSLGEVQKPNRYDPEAKGTPIGLDSLDRIDLAVKCEEEFCIKIEDDELTSPALDHVGAIVALVSDKLTQPMVLTDRQRDDFNKLKGGIAKSLDEFKPVAHVVVDEIPGDRLLLQLCRRAFDAGVKAGRADPNPAAAWHAFVSSEGLA